MAATNDSATSAALVAENWRLRNILSGIQAALDPDKKLSQQELIGRAWALVQAEKPGEVLRRTSDFYLNPQQALT